MRASTHPRSCTHKHTPTQKYLTLIAFPRQQWFRERASLLHYKYIVSLLTGSVLIKSKAREYMIVLNVINENN